MATAPVTKQHMWDAIAKSQDDILKSRSLNINHTGFDNDVWSRYISLKLFLMLDHLFKIKASVVDQQRDSYVMRRSSWLF